MESHPATVGTQAITIPFYHNATTPSRHSSFQPMHRQNTETYGPSKIDRSDSEVDSVSGSSSSSEWTPSSISGQQSTIQSRLNVRNPVVSPPNISHMTSEPDPYANRYQRKDKQKAVTNNSPPNTLPPLFTSSPSPLGPSMLSSSAYKSVNLNTHHDPDSNEPARIITYTKHSQGFTWNDELFLPSYLLGRYRYRGHGGSAARSRWGTDNEDDGMRDFDEEGERCPVTDIFVTDEEAAAMMP